MRRPADPTHAAAYGSGGYMGWMRQRQGERGQTTTEYLMIFGPDGGRHRHRVRHCLLVECEGRDERLVQQRQTCHQWEEHRLSGGRCSSHRPSASLTGAPACQREVEDEGDGIRRCQHNRPRGDAGIRAERVQQGRQGKADEGRGHHRGGDGGAHRRCHQRLSFPYTRNGGHRRAAGQPKKQRSAALSPEAAERCGPTKAVCVQRLNRECHGLDADALGEREHDRNEEGEENRGAHQPLIVPRQNGGNHPAGDVAEKPREPIEKSRPRAAVVHGVNANELEDVVERLTRDSQHLVSENRDVYDANQSAGVLNDRERQPPAVDEVPRTRPTRSPSSGLR